MVNDIFNVYDIWLHPHLPTPKEKNFDFLYLPLEYRKDKRLSYLDKRVYIALVMHAQLKREKKYSIKKIIADIGNHPDKHRANLDKYLKKTGKRYDELTWDDYKAIPKVPLTPKDIENSLRRLERFGYIRKKVPR